MENNKTPRLKLNKQLFIEKVETKIERRNSLLSFYKDVYLPTLQKFNGKVYNKRFINALRECADDLTCIRDLEYDHIRIQRRRDKFSYTEYEEMYILLKLDGDKRIDADASITDPMGQKWLNSFQEYNDELRSTINNYDKYMTIAEELQKCIYKYSEIPTEFRENIELYDKFYLK